MSIIRLTKEFSFEMAHTLAGYDGPCSQIHGHSYRLFVTVIGEPSEAPGPKTGMVLDFGILKHIVSQHIISHYDHALVIRATEVNREIVEALKVNFEKTVVVDYQPTCENMISRFAELIRKELPQGVWLHSLRLHETATSYAEWHASDNAV